MCPQSCEHNLQPAYTYKLVDWYIRVFSFFVNFKDVVEWPGAGFGFGKRKLRGPLKICVVSWHSCG